jgi:DNA repair protein RecO (recombination protein O)
MTGSGRPRLVRVGRTYQTEAVVLRSFRYAEADRVLHVYTRDRGRIGAIAKGVRKTTSRFGARLEPFSHVELMLHQGSGDLQTVTGASLVEAHRPTREDPYRLSVGLVGAEAMLRLFVEEERNDRAFEALTRFLDALDVVPAGLSARAALDALALAFQLKLLWLSGYVPHLEACVECEGVEGLVGYLPRAGGAVCAACAPTETVRLSPEGFRAIAALLRSPLADAHGLGLGERAARDALAVVVAAYEFHGGFRLRTLTA